MRAFELVTEGSGLESKSSSARSGRDCDQFSEEERVK